jgi:hypothetical protein
MTMQAASLLLCAALSGNEGAGVVDPTGTFRGCHLRLRAWFSDLNVTFNATLSGQLDTLAILRQAGYNTTADDPGLWTEESFHDRGLAVFCLMTPSASFLVSILMIGFFLSFSFVFGAMYMICRSHPSIRKCARMITFLLSHFSAEFVAGILVLWSLPIIHFEDREDNVFVIGALVPTLIAPVSLAFGFFVDRGSWSHR